MATTNDEDVKEFNNIVSQSVDLSNANVRNDILTGMYLVFSQFKTNTKQ